MGSATSAPPLARSGWSRYARHRTSSGVFVPLIHRDEPPDEGEFHRTLGCTADPGRYHNFSYIPAGRALSTPSRRIVIIDDREARPSSRFLQHSTVREGGDGRRDPF